MCRPAVGSPLYLEVPLSPTRQPQCPTCGLHLSDFEPHVCHRRYFNGGTPTVGDVVRVLNESVTAHRMVESIDPDGVLNVRGYGKITPNLLMIVNQKTP